MQSDLNFGKLDLNTPNHVQGHMKILYSSVKGICGLIFTFISVLEFWGSLGKLDPNTPNHAQEHIKSNPKTSGSHLTSNEVLLLCESHLRVQSYLSYGYFSIRGFGKNRAQIPPNHMKWHVKSNSVIEARYPKSWPCHSEC